MSGDVGLYDRVFMLIIIFLLHCLSNFVYYQNNEDSMYM